MPGLVQRYNVSVEYSELLSTTPKDPSVRGPSHLSGGRRWRSAAQAAIATEASSWYEAACPSSQDLQVVLRRFHDDPDISRELVFGFLCPLFVFGTLFTVCVVALQPRSFAHHILTAPREHLQELMKFGAALFGGLTAGILFLRTAVWCVAEASTAVVAQAGSGVGRTVRNSETLPSSNVLLGAMFG
ncbi:hypothetical protein BKA93DRAFT_723038 [Sparassis latifolia]